MPLPSLASSRSPLQALTPVAVIPEWISQRGQVSAALRNIEGIAIKHAVNRKGVHYYEIEIYEYTTKNRIPTNRPRHELSLPRTASLPSIGSPGCTRQSTARVERRFGEFVDLRGKVYNHAHLAHKSVPCAFCNQIINEIVWGDNQPGSLLFKFLTTEDKVMDLLAKSVNSLLALVNDNAEGHLCGGQDNIPQELFDFLFKQERATR
uniref:Uncharacterized protein n=1 Tax=Globisporangium ultimum (strain ATCC 200006 / CBS 805.95 / DAOM BR144) TaxID=431595 RepID=K3X9S4_GLOUD